MVADWVALSTSPSVRLEPARDVEDSSCRLWVGDTREFAGDSRMFEALRDGELVELLKLSSSRLSTSISRFLAWTAFSFSIAAASSSCCSFLFSSSIRRLSAASFSICSFCLEFSSCNESFEDFRESSEELKVLISNSSFFFSSLPSTPMMLSSL